MPKKIVIASMVVAGLVGVASVVDMAIGWPFGKVSMVMDVMFLLSAAAVGYMAFESFRELT